MPYIYKSGLQFGINETNIYGGAEYVELTQEEYDNLTDAEKHNGQIYFITDGNYDFLIVNDSVPVGSIQAYGGMSAPTNWLICDGSAVSRTDYKELFQAIGISFGEGDGVATFNLPDFRGRVLTGAGSLNSINYELGQQKSAGLPNITGSKKLGWSDSSGGGTIMQSDSNMGAFGIASSTTAHFAKGTGSGTYNNILTFNASNSNPIYGNSTTVQPNTTVANYIIKAKNPTPTSGQHLQAMELSYPVGSYFETSDSEFDPNVEWGGTWTVKQSKIEAVSYISNYTLGSFKNTAANAWQYTNLSFTVPNGHFYSIRIGAGWNSGRPTGIGVNYGTTSLAGDIPAYSNENTNGVYSMSADMLGPGTYYIFDKRATVPTLDNNVYFTAMDYVIGTSYKWHRTA